MDFHDLWANVFSRKKLKRHCNQALYDIRSVVAYDANIWLMFRGGAQNENLDYRYFRHHKDCCKICQNFSSTIIRLCLLASRGEYFPLCCDNHHGIVSKFDQISEKFLFQKSKKSVTFEKTVKKNPDFHILFGLIVHSND